MISMIAVDYIPKKTHYLVEVMFFLMVLQLVTIIIVPSSVHHTYGMVEVMGERKIKQIKIIRWT